MNSVNVEDIMKNIRVKKENCNLNSTQLGYVTPYFKGFVETLKKREHLVIMGMGDNGKRLYDICMELKLGNVSAICDNNKIMQEMKYRGSQIISPEQAVQQYPGVLYVITSQTAVIHMVAQLMELGVSVNDIEFLNISRTGLV